MDSRHSLSDLAAEAIRRELGGRDWSKSELARRLGVSHTWVTNRLAGHQAIGLDELGRIAEALEVDIADLLPARSQTGASHKAYSVPDSPAGELDSAEWTSGPPRDAHSVRPTSHQRHGRGTHSRHGGRRPAIQPWAHEGVAA